MGKTNTMKKLNLLLACMIMSATLFSCSSEEKTVQQETAKNAEFAKTAEMLNFESSLKEWMQAKRENAGAQAKAETSAKIATDATALLKAIGASQANTDGKSAQSTEELVRIAMKAYSVKLTEMYHAQNK